MDVRLSPDTDTTKHFAGVVHRPPSRTMRHSAVATTESSAMCVLRAESRVSRFCHSRRRFTSGRAQSEGRHRPRDRCAGALVGVAAGARFDGALAGAGCSGRPRPGQPDPVRSPGPPLGDPDRSGRRCTAQHDRDLSRASDRDGQGNFVDAGCGEGVGILLPRHLDEAVRATHGPHDVSSALTGATTRRREEDEGRGFHHTGHVDGRRGSPCSGSGSQPNPECDDEQADGHDHDPDREVTHRSGFPWKRRRHRRRWRSIRQRRRRRPQESCRQSRRR